VTRGTDRRAGHPSLAASASELQSHGFHHYILCNRV
jgi:hypothetical protein